MPTDETLSVLTELGHQVSVLTGRALQLEQENGELKSENTQLKAENKELRGFLHKQGFGTGSI